MCFVVGGNIRNSRRLLRKRVEVLIKFFPGKTPVDRDAVTDHMQVVFLKIDHPVTASVGNVCVMNVPLRRNGPIKNLRSGRHFMSFEGDAFAKDCQGLANAVAGNAATDWKEPLKERIHRLTSCHIRSSHSTHLLMSAENQGADERFIQNA